MLPTESPTPERRGPGALRFNRPRWYELVPEVALAAGLTLFLVDETDAATSAFKSGRALVLMAVVAIGWVVARVFLMRLLGSPVLRTAIFAVAAAGILAVAVVPAYDDDTVVETLPGATAGAGGTKSTGSDQAMDKGEPSPDAPASAGAQPVRFRVGSFRGVDHRAAGTVALYRKPDGRFLIGLEDFDIQPGPDYDVYAVPGKDREDLAGAIRIDDLRANRGTQFYDVPTTVDLDNGPWTVLVWCHTFAVPIANATPA